ncbi:GmrSD restriction endonuclease domain-containing protein [Phyllobacterium bourgognense]|uniref:GmrSD restriction endonucleases N-terminal domain-containing protein n=1 Tax=Phyllobacterium bourgognense TaxID=314236 RepID=A0A368Z554_9HYPH|nr:DUF262 domain-containing protein [Phyllobacterium bourgognense]RCW87575.1 hypothetical protein C7476_101341 [Phyllobacterium bourgognense]
MSAATFKTNPYYLHELLKDCSSGILQLPDFQRSWVWDEDRIKSLISSVSRAFPVGALMTLETGGEVDFKPRPIEGAPDSAKSARPRSLLLDGQQRMTSLYQVSLRDSVVETITPKKKKVKRWFYIDIEKALNEAVDREEAIIGVPEDKIVRENFGREVAIDLSSRDREFETLHYPVSMVFNWDEWQKQFIEFTMQRGDFTEKWETIRQFKENVIDNFVKYQVPVITLDLATSKEAVCVVFEKVNTGGKPLDAFELVTAMYAAEGYQLRKDWYGEGKGETGRHTRLASAVRLADAEKGILAEVSNTDFLQVISLFHTRDRRRLAEAAGKQGKELPQITGNRQALLGLPLTAYKQYQAQAERGFLTAAKFLHMLHIYRIFDLPYQSQIIPLAAILADIGEAWEHEAVRAKLIQWYWNGVFGELYGSAVDTRVAKDFVEVPIWIRSGPPPSTVSETIFRSDRLKSMRMRLSAAYKGVNALLMKEGARDFRSGQAFNHTAFFGENVDIHHIFPQAWCRQQGINPDIFDSIINKTPLSYRTNRIVGGEAPSAYLTRLEKGTTSTGAISFENLDTYLASHLINPAFLRADNFEAFMADRQEKLLALIERAMGKEAYRGDLPEEGIEDERDDDGIEAQMTIAAE